MGEQMFMMKSEVVGDLVQNVEKKCERQFKISESSRELLQDYQS
jgi:hypothetical protein